MNDKSNQLLLADHIVSGYGTVHILKGVSISVAHGEVVTIIGPNGAGKSTLLRAILGLLPVFEGSVRFKGKDITTLSTEQRILSGIGFVPQTNNVFPSLTVRENLEMGGYTIGENLEERVSWVIDLFPALEPRLGERAGRLSGGQRQMVAIGRALMLEPSMMVLDEPSASLSPQMSETVFERVKEINRLGTAVLLVEQDARHALAISHRGYVLAGGENRLEGPAADLLDREDVRRLYLGG